MNEPDFITLLRSKMAEIGGIRASARLWGVNQCNIQAFLKGDLNTGRPIARAPIAMLIGMGYRKIKHINYVYEERVITYTYEKK